MIGGQFWHAVRFFCSVSLSLWRPRRRSLVLARSKGLLDCPFESWPLPFEPKRAADRIYKKPSPWHLSLFPSTGSNQTVDTKNH